jgi:hypothetical protein
MGNNAEDQLRCSEGDSETAPGLSDDSLSKHPRIVRLRQQVAALPVDQGYRSRLFHSIDFYAAQIISRPVYAPEEGWDDLEAVQQVTLSDAVEQEMQRLLQSPPIRPADVTYQGLPEENDHFVVKITKDKVMGRSAFLQAIESLDRPDYELPAEMDEDAKAVILRTRELLKAQGQGASSLVSRQPIKDLVATHTPSLEAQELMAATSGKAEAQPAPTSNAPAFDPNAPETEADGIRAGALRVLKVLRRREALQAQTPGSSPSPSNTPETTVSTSSDKPNTPK